MTDPNADRRPGGGGDQSSDEQGCGPEAILAQEIRNRRAASLRLPPLQSGYRDPLDDVPQLATHGAILAAQALLSALGLTSEVTRATGRASSRVATGDPDERFAHDVRSRGAGDAE